VVTAPTVVAQSLREAVVIAAVAKEEAAREVLVMPTPRSSGDTKTKVFR